MCGERFQRSVRLSISDRDRKRHRDTEATAEAATDRDTEMRETESWTHLFLLRESVQQPAIEDLAGELPAEPFPDQISFAPAI